MSSVLFLKSLFYSSKSMAIGAKSATLSGTNLVRVAASKMTFYNVSSVSVKLYLGKLWKTSDKSMMICLSTKFSGTFVQCLAT